MSDFQKKELSKTDEKYVKKQVSKVKKALSSTKSTKSPQGSAKIMHYLAKTIKDFQGKFKKSLKNPRWQQVYYTILLEIYIIMKLYSSRLRYTAAAAHQVEPNGGKQRWDSTIYKFVSTMFTSSKSQPK